MGIIPGMINGGRLLRSPASDGSAGHVLTRGATADSTEWAAASGGSAEIDVNTQTSGYTLQSGDRGDLIDFTTAGVTLTLLAAATAGDKFYFYVRHSGAVSTVLTVDGNSSETIDGALTLTMFSGEVRLLICDGSNWISIEIERPTFGRITKPIDGDFAWINQSSATIATTRGGLVLSAPSNGGGFAASIRKKTAPATPYTITACLQASFVTNNNGQCGLCFRQSSDGKLVTFCPVWVGASIGGFYIRVAKYTNATTYSTDYILHGGTGLLAMDRFYLRIADNGTNRICSLSQDGENFVEIHSVSRTDYLTADEVGFFVDPISVAVSMTITSWREA